MQLQMALGIHRAFAHLLSLEVVGHHLRVRCGLGVGDVVDVNIHHVVATHLGSHGEVGNDDVLLLLHIVVIIVAVGVAPIALIVVFLVIIGLPVPITGFSLVIVVNHGGLHLVGGEGVVGGTEIEAQLVHRARLHLNVIGNHDGESLPLVGIRIVDGQADFLLQTASLTHAVGLIQFVVLQERQYVVVENTHNPQRHRIEADGVEIDGGLIHVGNDDAIVSPAHLGLHLGQVELILIVILEHHAVVGADAAVHANGQILHLVSVEVALVEVEVNLISLDVSLIAQIVVLGNEAGEVLGLLQRLAEEQGGVVGILVHIKGQRNENALGVNGQVAFHLGLGVDRLTVEDDVNVVVFILAFKVLHQKVVDIVARVCQLHGMVFAEGSVEQVDGIVLVDRHGKGDAQVVVHLFVRQADGLLGHEAEVLAAHAEAELKHRVASHFQEFGHLELADVVLVLVDVVVLEADGVFVNPNGFAFQGGRKLEGFGGDGFAILHFQHLGVLEAHHDRLARGDHTRGVAVEQWQQSLIQGLDAFNVGLRSTNSR